MTDYTPEALEALSKKASDARKAYDTHPDHDTLCALLEHEKRFGYVLADLYRTGQLIHAVPSGDEVEAVARAIRRSEIGNFSDEARAQYVVDGSWEHRIPEATAAITALDTVRGKQ